MRNRIRSGLFAAITAALLIAPVASLPAQADNDEIVTLDSVDYYVDRTTIDVFNSSGEGTYERIGNRGRDLVSISPDHKTATIRQNKCEYKDPQIEVVPLSYSLKYTAPNAIKAPVGGRLFISAPFTGNALNDKVALHPANPNYTFNAEREDGLPAIWPLVGTRTTQNPMTSHSTEAAGSLKSFQMSFWCNRDQTGTWTLHRPIVSQYSPVITPTITPVNPGPINLAQGEKALFNIAFPLDVTGIVVSDLSVNGFGSEYISNLSGFGKNYSFEIEGLVGSETPKTVGVSIRPGILDINEKETRGTTSAPVSYISTLDLSGVPAGDDWIINRDSSLTFPAPAGTARVLIEPESQPRSLARASATTAINEDFDVNLDNGQVTLSGRVATPDDTPVNVVFIGQDGSAHPSTIVISGQDPQLADSQTLNVVRNQASPADLVFAHEFDEYQLDYIAGLAVSWKAETPIPTISLTLTTGATNSSGKVLFFDAKGYLGFAPFVVAATEPPEDNSGDGGNPGNSDPQITDPTDGSGNNDPSDPDPSDDEGSNGTVPPNDNAAPSGNPSGNGHSGPTDSGNTTGTNSDSSMNDLAATGTPHWMITALIAAAILVLAGTVLAGTVVTAKKA